MARRGNSGSASGRRRRDSGNKKPIIILVVLAIFGAIAWYIWGSTPTQHRLPYEGTVAGVNEDGTLVMDNGLKVEMLGVSLNSNTIAFLRDNICGKIVRLNADSHDTKPYYLDANKDMVRAYVTLIGSQDEYAKLNGYLLQSSKAGLSPAYCQDSLNAFRRYLQKDSDPGQPDPGQPGPGKQYNKQTLFKYMAPSTFLIQTHDSNGNEAIGTGFFINENGLALTNYHVLAGANSGKIFLCDEKGNITADRDRDILRVIQYSSKYDWCIFVVSLDPGEKSPYLNLARQRPERGVEVGVVGNPRGLLATYTTGQVTNLHEEHGKIQIDASMTQGNSGGPICNFKGEVVGIAQSVVGNPDGTNATGNLNLGTDIMVVRKALDQLKDVKTYGGK